MLQAAVYNCKAPFGRRASAVCRHASALTEQHSRFVANLEALESTVDGLKATSAADGSAWSERLQSEMASQRQQNDRVRAAVEEEVRQLRHDRDVAHGQLTVLSKQHQAALRQREQEHQDALQMATAKAQALRRELAELPAALVSTLEAAHAAEGALAEVRRLRSPRVRVCASTDECEAERTPHVQASAHMKPAEVAAVGCGEVQPADVDQSADAAHVVVLRQLGEAVARIAATCAGIAGSRLDARPIRKLVLPELSDQERTLRATLDKLVRASGIRARPRGRTPPRARDSAQSHHADASRVASLALSSRDPARRCQPSTQAARAGAAVSGRRRVVVRQCRVSGR